MIVPLHSWTPKTCIWYLEFRWYVVNKLRYMYLKFRSRHLGFSTSNNLLTWNYHRYNISGLSVADNVGVAVRRMFTTSVYYMVYSVHMLYLLLPVWAAISVKTLKISLIYFLYIVKLSFLETIIKVHSCMSCWYKIIIICVRGVWPPHEDVS